MIELGQLEANITLHCNKRCVSCSHAAPWHKPYLMDAETLWGDLVLLRPFVRCRLFALLGGEPLLHPNIVEMIKTVRNSMISHEVGVTTNGLLLPRMPLEFWRTIHVIQISFYPNVDKKGILEFTEAKQKEYGFSLYYRDYTTFKRQNGRCTRAQCNVRCPTVHEGKFYLCPQSLTFPGRFMGLPEDIDGLTLSGLTEGKLREFLDRPPEMNACRICGGESSEAPWAEASSEDEWRKLSGL